MTKFGKVTLTAAVRGNPNIIKASMRTLKIGIRKAMGVEMDNLCYKLQVNCPSPSLAEAFHVNSTFTKSHGQVWFIEILELPSVSSRRGWGTIKNEYSTYQKVMAVEYGRPAIPATGKAPLSKSTRTKHGGVERYMGTKMGVSPKAQAAWKGKPSIIIRTGPFEKVEPTYFILFTVTDWEATIQNNMNKATDSLLAANKYKR